MALRCVYLGRAMHIGWVPISNLPDLIIAVMPKVSFNRLGWDHLIDSPLIRWKTVGVQESKEPRREGFARVRVAGLPATAIRPASR